MKPIGWLAATGLAVAPSDRGPADFSGAFAEAPVLTWRTELPGEPVPSATHTELGAPLLHGDHVYVGSAGSEALHVLDRRTGQVVDAYAAHAPVQSRPVIVDEVLYFSDAGGTTWAYVLGDDTPRWKHESGAPILGSPTLQEDMVYISNLDNVVVALKRVSGELEWRYAHRLDATRSVELELYGAPSPEPAGELLLAGFSDGRLVGLDIVSGEPQWQRTIGEGAYPDLIAPAVATDDAALVSGFSEPLLVLDLEGRAVRWRQEVGGPQVPTVLDLPQGKTIFHGGVDGELRRIDLRTGEVAWSWDSGTGTALSTPVPTEAGMLVAASGGALYLVDPESGGLSWAWRPMFHSSGITATPAVEGRQAVVVTNAGYIMSFVSPAAPAEDPGWDLTGPAR